VESNPCGLCSTAAPCADDVPGCPATVKLHQTPPSASAIPDADTARTCQKYVPGAAFSTVKVVETAVGRHAVPHVLSLVVSMQIW
jgi:hypothetical protein